MTNKMYWLGILAVLLVFGMTACDNDNGDGYQGTYNVYGYFHNFLAELLLWNSLTDSSYDSLKAGLPIKIVLSSNTITFTGGQASGETEAARISGNTLFATIDGTEVVLGTFNSGDFHWTFMLNFASEGAYVVYKK